MGFLQMAVAAIGTFTVAALPYQHRRGLIAVVGGFIAAALAAGVIAVARTAGGPSRHTSPRPRTGAALGPASKPAPRA